MKENIKYDIGDTVKIRRPSIHNSKIATCVISMITVTKKGIKYRGKDCDEFDSQHDFPQDWIIEGQDYGRIKEM